VTLSPASGVSFQVVDVESLYRTHGPMVLRRCRRLLRDEGRALDAMHDVFVEILRRRDRLDDRAPAALLLTTATNVCLNRLRTQRRHPEDAGDAALLAIAQQDSPEERSLARRVLDRMFARTPASTALIAVLHHVDRLTLEEVAAEVGMSVSGVRKRLRTLKAQLPEAPRLQEEGKAHG
jgi:RNA polymerase sigma-70 factor (ECF subfamily)